MFEYFTFSAPARMNDISSRGDISPTNTDYIETLDHESNSVQSTPPVINELVMKLSVQTLDCSHLPAQRHREQDMVHPNLIARSADNCSLRMQRQILQEQQCRPTFTRDLHQLLEGMIEKGDQCRFTTSVMSSPPPSRGRDRRFSDSSSMGTSISHTSPLETTHEDAVFCEIDETSVSYTSAFNAHSTPSSTSALRPIDTSTYSRHSPPGSGKGSRHRRVASEGNIDVDFDIHDNFTCREVSLRRAGAPVGVAKSGRPRGRASYTNIKAVVERRHNVPRLRKPRKAMVKRNGA